MTVAHKEPKKAKMLKERKAPRPGKEPKIKKEKKPSRRLLAYAYIKEHGPSTAAEVCYGLHKPKGEVKFFSTALVTQQKKGVIRATNKEKCKATSKMATKYELTEINTQE